MCGEPIKHIRVKPILAFFFLCCMLHKVRLFDNYQLSYERAYFFFFFIFLNNNNNNKKTTLFLSFKNEASLH